MGQRLFKHVPTIAMFHIQIMSYLSYSKTNISSDSLASFDLNDSTNFRDLFAQRLTPLLGEKACESYMVWRVLVSVTYFLHPFARCKTRKARTVLHEIFLYQYLSVNYVDLYLSSIKTAHPPQLLASIMRLLSTKVDLPNIHTVPSVPKLHHRRSTAALR